MTVSAIPSPMAQQLAILAGRYDPAGRRILDIGCGGGDFLRQLLGAGADAVGLEVFEAPLARARAAGIAPERLVLGDGQTLPFADGAFDAAVFVFSFHHVPGDQQPAVLAEAARILAPGGALFVFEPRPWGDLTEILAPIHDEVEVRTNAQARLDAGPAPFRLIGRTDYELTRRLSGVDQLIQAAVDVDPARAERAAAPGVRDDVAARFARLAEPLPDGAYRLRQPCVFYHLQAP